MTVNLRDNLSGLNSNLGSLYSNLDKNRNLRTKQLFEKSGNLQSNNDSQKNYLYLKQSGFFIDTLACNACFLEDQAKAKIELIKNKWSELKVCYKKGVQENTAVDPVADAVGQVKQTLLALDQIDLVPVVTADQSDRPAEEIYFLSSQKETLEQTSLLYPLTVALLLEMDKKLTKGAFGEKLKEAYEAFAPELSYHTQFIKLIILDACMNDSSIDSLDCIPEESKYEASDVLRTLKWQCFMQFAEQGSGFIEKLLLIEEKDLGEFECSILRKLTQIVNLVKLDTRPDLNISFGLLKCMRDGRLHLNHDNLFKVIDFLAWQKPALAVQLCAQSDMPFTSLLRIAMVAQSMGNEKIIHKVGRLFTDVLESDHLQSITASTDLIRPLRLQLIKESSTQLEYPQLRSFLEGYIITSNQERMTSFRRRMNEIIQNSLAAYTRSPISQPTPHVTLDFAVGYRLAEPDFNAGYAIGAYPLDSNSPSGQRVNPTQSRRPRHHPAMRTDINPDSLSLIGAASGGIGLSATLGLGFINLLQAIGSLFSRQDENPER